MFSDSSGCFPILITLGIPFGASIGFRAVAYSDYQDDGLIFNGSISWQTYLGGTLIGGAVGGLIGYAMPAITSFMGSSFTLGGGMVMTASGQMIMTAGITITGAQVIGAVGALGALYMFAKGSGARMGHNQYENRQFDQLCKKYNLSKDQRRILHDYISGKNLTYKEIERIIIELFFN